jgi:antitoxin component of MazEF toxin-antitoxin module
MQYERKIRKWGDSLVFPIPIDIAKYMELEEGTDIILQDDIGKHGKFLAMWNKDNSITNKR